MSYQKKSLILQELEQAIRKKAQEKSRNKEQMNRVLQGSIQKKKNVLKTATNKETRVASIHKNTDTASKQNLADKPVSIFNNEHLNVFDSNELKAKKYNNRRLDKLVSLIQYMVSSSEKALRYISSTNFQAEFALKLYRSDRQNLVNQLKNLNFDDIMDSQRAHDKSAKPEQAYTMLLQENNKLKKEILILEKEAESYHNKVKDNDSLELKQHQREINKLRQMLRKLMPFEGFKQVIELLQKQNKFEVMAVKSQQNSKKTTQIQIVLSSLENERSSIIESLGKTNKQGKSDRAYKLSEIQGQKEQLQKELSQMKVKLAEIIDSGKSINELEFLKKNSELITEKLSALHKELSPNTLAKRSSEQIIEHIRMLSLNLQQKNQQLNQAVNHLSQQNDSLKEDIDRLKYQKKQLENDARSEGDEARMENMLTEIQKLRDIVDELGQGQEISSQRILQLEDKLKAKEEEVSDLASQLSEAVEKANDFKAIINELNDQINQVQSQFTRTINQNANLNEKLRITQNDIISNSYSKEELKKLQADKENLSKKLQTVNNRNNYLEQQIKQLESQMIEKEDQLQQISKKVTKENSDSKKIQLKMQQTVRQLNSKKQEIDFLKEQKTSMQKLMEQQRQKHISDGENLNKRLHEAQLVNIKLSKQKMEVKGQLEVQRQQIQSLNNKIGMLYQEIKQLQEEIRSLTIMSNDAVNQKQYSKDLLIHAEKERQFLKSELTNVKQQMQDHSEIIRSKNKQYVNLLRQILKGLLLDPSEYADKTTFQELLEFGSQQVVQIRKRQREQESNKRKNTKREYDNILNEFSEHEQSLQECKVRLFQQHSGNLFEKKQPKEEENVDIDEFNELKQQPNDSMISEQCKDHPEEASLSEYADQQEQKLSESMMSNEMNEGLPERLSSNSQHKSHQEQESSQQIAQNKLINEIPQRISLNSLHRSQQEKKMTQSVTQDNLFAQLPQKLSLDSVHNSHEDHKRGQINNKQQNQQVYELTSSKIQEQGQNISQFNEIEQNVSESMISEKPIEIKITLQKQSKHNKSQDQDQENEGKQKLNDDYANNLSGIDGGMENNSMLFHAQLNNQDLLNDSSKLKPKQRPSQSYSKHTLLSIALKDEKLDLDQFQEAKSVQGNHSFVSSNQNIDSHRQYAFHKHEEQEMGESEIKMVPLQLNQFSNEEDMKLQEFKEIDADPLSESMVSHKEDQHNIDQFGQIGQNGLSQSMVSIQEKRQSLKAVQDNPFADSKKSEDLGLQQFGQVENQMNNSMLSQKQSQHGLSEFGQLPEQRLNESLLSEKHEIEEAAEHGMSQFGEVQENQMNDSLLSQNYNLKNSNNSEQNKNFDQFEQYKSQKMSQSMISQNSGIISRLKSDESFESPEMPQ